jgi:geranylgeranyl pyrophosphate synthase
MPADESPHADSALEWWFVHGYYEGPASGRRYFMATIFRHALGARPDLETDGASLLLEVLDPSTGRHATASIVDARVVDWTVTQGRGLFEATNVDPGVVKAFLKEVALYGPPRPVVRSTERPQFHQAPFRATWRDFELAQDAGAFRLRFTEPESGRDCSFALGPLPPRLDVMSDAGEHAPFGMEYVTYPRIALEGQVSGEPVAGEVWMDHQWGSLRWLLEGDDGRRVLGWDWLGINLDDGSDWIVMVHRDAQSGAVVGRHATVWDAARRARRSSRVTMTPLRQWRSPRTKITHPVAWRIELPELGAAFVFEPLADDQEVALFGTGRAIWEGAGTVSGAVNGRAVRGRARGEFQGYGHLFDFQAHLDELAAGIDADIAAFFPREIDAATLRRYTGEPDFQHAPEAHTATLARPVWDLIARKGKRWRPAFGLLMLEVLGEACEPHRAMMCLLAELAHTGSLIIDDIEDASTVRRGGPTLHERYGVDVALNAGNTLYFLPTQLVKEHPLLDDRQKLEIYQIINDVYVRAHCGQGLDIYWSSHMSRDNLDRWMADTLSPKILQGYAYKTAAPIAGFAEIAAVIARVTPQVRAAASAFGRAFGVSFQILDDVRNFSSSPHWTKVAGEDLEAGKLTYVVVRALELLDAPGRERLIALLCRPKADRTAEEVAAGIDLVRASGALRSCKAEAQKLVRDAWNAFAGLVPSSSPKMLLDLLCEQMLELPYDP